MSYSSDLRDEEWAILEPMLPSRNKTRKMKWSYRQIMNGIFYQLKQGCKWQDLPKDFPPYSTVYWHYKHLRADGTIEEIMLRLSKRVRGKSKKRASLVDNSGFTGS